MTELIRARGALPAVRAGLAGPVVLVPTMGALHKGHRELLRTARSHAGREGAVVVSVFVNPLQFGPGEDLDRYPRTLDSDVAMCAEEGVAAVFAPSAAEMYPDGAPIVTIDPGPIGTVLEGEFRPGFFGGVLTVVLKLFNLVRPDVAVFGQKDAQQLAMVRRMVCDLDLGISIVAVPTVRDPDGLAVSSRNQYLSAADRVVALALSRALRVGADAALRGADPADVVAAARQVLDAEPGLSVDYLALVNPATFTPVGSVGSVGTAAGGAVPAVPAVLAVAARAGATRLIDNMPVDLKRKG